MLQDRPHECHFVDYIRQHDIANMPQTTEMNLFKGLLMLRPRNFRFTAPLPGRYRFTACLNTNATNASAATAYVALYKNGSNFRASGAGIPGGANFVAPQIDAMLYLNAGDYVECWASIPASSGSPSVSGGATGSYFEGQYVG